jgi:hypothetical protein
MSVAANILAVWYIRRVLARLSYVNENIGDLSALIGSYQKHLTGIFSLEQYYGDQDMKFLLDHTRSLKDILNEYSEVSNLLEEPQEIEEEQEGEPEDATPTVDEENVFYAGTRTSDN